ncbi:hypothetical protein SNE40_018469 [Patella caerulea]|uniref:FLYWCH-type domain-containing protein n=1 Tax=Patella caerulea TaxID=87958 RepID=A0AAN8J7C0_PATCE
MEIIKNNKGGSKLSCEGYMYTKKSVNKTTLRWECSQRHSRLCKGSLTTDLEVQGVVLTVPHSHDPDHDCIEATKIVATMKQAAINCRAKPAQLLSDFTCKATTEVRADVVRRLVR